MISRQYGILQIVKGGPVCIQLYLQQCVQADRNKQGKAPYDPTYANNCRPICQEFHFFSVSSKFMRIKG